MPGLSQQLLSIMKQSSRNILISSAQVLTLVRSSDAFFVVHLNKLSNNSFSRDVKSHDDHVTSPNARRWSCNLIECGIFLLETHIDYFYLVETDLG